MCFCLNYDVNYKWEVFDISMFTPPENGVYGLDEGDLIYVLDNQFSSWIEKKQKRELKTISKHELVKWVSCFTQVTKTILTSWWCYKHSWLADDVTSFTYDWLWLLARPRCPRCPELTAVQCPSLRAQYARRSPRPVHCAHYATAHVWSDNLGNWSRSTNARCSRLSDSTLLWPAALGASVNCHHPGPDIITSDARTIRTI